LRVRKLELLSSNNSFLIPDDGNWSFSETLCFIILKLMDSIQNNSHACYQPSYFVFSCSCVLLSGPETT
jgi:hypothetical protein